MTKRPDPYERARSQAAEAFAKHEMTVRHNDGLYRHLRFRQPRTWCYGFDLVTWPGFLYVGGDIENYTFARVPDMFEFFGEKPDINPHYWAEKITNRSVRTRRFSERALREWVASTIEESEEPAALHAAWQEHAFGRDLGSDHTAREVLAEFKPFADPFDWADFSEWDHHFLLSCFAIVHGLKMWLSHHGGVLPIIHPEVPNARAQD